MPRPYYTVLNASIAGATAALFLLAGRWNPGRLLGIESQRHFELNASMFLEPRQWALPILAFTVLWLNIPRQVPTTNQDLSASRYGKFAFVCLVLLMLYLMLSVMWAPVLGLSILKAYETLLTFCILLAIGFWYRSTDAELFHQAFWKSLLLMTGMMMLVALISLGNGRLAVLGGGPNVFARLMFLFAAGCMGLSKQRHPLQLFLAIIAIGLIVLSGSRGGMMAATVGGAVYLWAERTKVSSKFLLVTGGLATGLLLLSITPLGNRVYETFSYRIVELTFQDGYTSGRDILVEEAIEIWKEYPVFGSGISGWTALMIERNEINISHPHNLFCEILCEGGLIAVGLLILAIGSFLRCALLLRHRLHVPSLASAVMFLSASQFSGDFFDSRGIFICAMLSLFPCKVKTNLPNVAKQPFIRRLASSQRHPRPRSTINGDLSRTGGLSRESY